MKRQAITTLLAMLSFGIFSQHNIGVKASGGVSKISNSWVSVYPGWTIHIAPSGNGGIYYNYDIEDHSILGAELLFSQMEGREKIEIDLISGSDPAGHLQNAYYNHLSYLALPVYYGLNLGRFNINAGFQISYAIRSSGRNKSTGIAFGKSIETDEKYDELYFNKFDFGPRVGFLFNLNDRIAIEGVYYYGINNLHKPTISIGSDWKRRVQQLTIGLRYTFVNV